MTLKVIGAGFGRTGTLSLKLALDELGLGPCYHMIETIAHPDHDAMWLALARGETRDWRPILKGHASTEPVTRKLVEEIIADAAKDGIKLMADESYRSKARQEKLFAQGATKIKTVGVHHYGLACDLVKDIGGEPSWQGDFKQARQEA